MFIYLSKIIPPLIYPLGLTCLALLAALFTQRRPRLQRALLLAALLILWLCSTHLVVDPLTYYLEDQFRTPPELQRPTLEKGISQPLAPVIVVLGGSVGPASPPRQVPEMGSSTTARLIYAAYLYKLGVAPHLLLTSGTIDWMGDQGSPTDDMRFLLSQLGVPDSAIWIEDQSRNTYENAVFSQKILAERGIQKIILLTSATHMPRSVALFRKVGLEVIPAPSDIQVSDNDLEALRSLNPATQLLNLLPNPGSLGRLTVTMKEYLGIVVYHLRGWI